ncbi:MAG: complex I subunit 5 family protein [Thermoproteus sp.]
MYSEIFLLVTAASTALALAAVRLGMPAALASTASTLLYFLMYGGTADLGALPYIGAVQASLDVWKAPFVATASILGVLVTLYAPRYLEHLGADRWYYAVHALYVLSFDLIVLFENLVMVFLALELSIITSFLLIWYFGYGNRRRIGLLYFIWAQVGSIMFLVGVAYSGSFEAYAFEAAGAASFLVLLGLLIKMGTAGVHFWLPYAHAEAPTPLSALLSPVHVGLMSYWIWRLEAGAGWPSEALYLYGLATAIYGSLLVFREADIKRALADSTIANMGLLLAAASIGGRLGFLATALLFMGHAFAKAAGFMLSGIYITEKGVRDIDRLGLTRPLFAVGSMAFIALAGVFGVNLLGKALVAIGVPHAASAVALLVAALFSTALYSFYLLHRIYKSGEAGPEAHIDMLLPTLAAAAAPYVLLILGLLWL